MNGKTKLARRLRTNLTDAEKYLWYILRRKNLNGLKFRRQQPIGRYIVDFVCFENKLVIELDGGQHAEQIAEDQKRDRWLRSQGFRVLRFWNNEVLDNRDAVVETILKYSADSHPPLTPPLQGGECPHGSS
jgi:very-short-patch-repair endonuclease